MSNLGPYDLDSIVVGDSKELAAAIPDESVDLVLTDPPFGIGFSYEGYTDDPGEYLSLVSWIVSEANRVIRPGGLCFVFQAMPRLMGTLPLFPESARIFAACKNFVQIRPIPVQFSFDPVVFWQKPGGEKWAYKGRDWHVGDTSPKKIGHIDHVDFHECPRPLNTISYMVESFCPDGGIVFDPFMGSGTTAVAARLSGRRFLGFEIREDVAIKAMSRVESLNPLFGSAYSQMEMVL